MGDLLWGDAFSRAVIAAMIGAAFGSGARIVLGLPWAVIAVIAVIAALAALPGTRKPREGRFVADAERGREFR